MFTEKKTMQWTLFYEFFCYVVHKFKDLHLDCSDDPFFMMLTKPKAESKKIFEALDYHFDGVLTKEEFAYLETFLDLGRAHVQAKGFDL